MSDGSELSWSQWLDFDRANILTTPQIPGVFLMHASMKVMYIGGSNNIQQSLLALLSDPCAGKAKRFHYMPTPEPDKIKEKLLSDHVQKHHKLPQCMEEK